MTTRCSPRGWRCSMRCTDHSSMLREPRAHAPLQNLVSAAHGVGARRSVKVCSESSPKSDSPAGDGSAAYRHCRFSHARCPRRIDPVVRGRIRRVLQLCHLPDASPSIVRPRTWRRPCPDRVRHWRFNPDRHRGETAGWSAVGRIRTPPVAHRRRRGVCDVAVHISGGVDARGTGSTAIRAWLGHCHLRARRVSESLRHRTSNEARHVAQHVLHGAGQDRRSGPSWRAI
jgi:hypothetical protein